MHEFRGSSLTGVGKDAMGAAGDKLLHVGPHLGPEEPDPKAVKGFVTTHVPSCRSGMVYISDCGSESIRDNNEEQAGGATLNRF